MLLKTASFLHIDGFTFYETLSVWRFCNQAGIHILDDSARNINCLYLSIRQLAEQSRPSLERGFCLVQCILPASSSLSLLLLSSSLTVTYCTKRKPHFPQLLEDYLISMRIFQLQVYTLNTVQGFNLNSQKRCLFLTNLTGRNEFNVKRRN
jgi:hypothetical protein